jgi:hypothetical protein
MVKRVTTVFSGVPGSPYYSNHYFSDAGAAGDLVTDVGGFWDLCAVHIANNLVWTVQGDVATIDIATGQITAMESVTGSNGAGEHSAQMLPPAAQGLVQWQTAQYNAGRRLRGRTFVPGLTVSDSADGEVHATTQAALLAAGTALIDSIDSELVVFSRTGQQAAVVTDCTVWNQFAQLRSRRD